MERVEHDKVGSAARQGPNGVVRPGHGRRSAHLGVAAGWLACVAAVGVACGSDGRNQGLPPLDITSGDVDGGLGPDSVDSGMGGGGGGPRAPADGGVPDGGDGPRCGDGHLDDGEACDGSEPPNRSCLLLGFDEGTLSCSPDCTWNTASCSGTESCADGRDNDGDGDADCSDTDCSASCADACLEPPSVEVNSSVNASTTGHGTPLVSSCGGSASAPEVAYQVSIAEDGKLDVLIAGEAELGVSVRTACGDENTEAACGMQTRVTLDVLAGESYFIVVDGVSSEDAGEFLLEVTHRQVACGDAIRDSHEECDDGNINDGDGCDPDCFLESSETEPNGTLGSADVYAFEPWAAELAPEGDEDFYAVTLTASSSTLVIDTLNFGDGACGFNLMDTVIEVFDTNANANALLASDDDGGDGKCARAIASGLGPGTYYVKVAAGEGAAPATFPYRLGVFVGECGDGERTLGEECDDQNLIAGDGCDANCRSET